MSKYLQAKVQAEKENGLGIRGETRRSPVRPTRQAKRESSESRPSAKRKRRDAPQPTFTAGHTGDTQEIRESRLVSLHAPVSFAAEQYRSICHGIEKRHTDTGLSVIGISSALMGDGKTVTAINIAGTLSQVIEARVLLVDLDLRRPAVADTLGLSQAQNRGVADFVQDSTLFLTDVVKRLPSFNLNVLVAGRIPEDPSKILQSPRLEALFAEAHQDYEYIVVDTPPCLAVPDCQLLERWIDGFVLVVAAHRTPRKLVEETFDNLNPYKVAGMILNYDETSQYGSYHESYVSRPAAKHRQRR